MMKKYTQTLSLVVLNLMALCSVANAALISATVHDYSSRWNADYSATKVVDGSGLTSAGTDAWTHNTVGTDMYLANNVRTGWLEFDLGAVTNLTEIHIWNGNSIGTLNDSHERIDRGAKTIKVYVSNDGGIGDDQTDDGIWTFVEEITLLKGTGLDTYVGERFNIADTTGQYVRLDITLNHGAASLTLSEVHFYTVPEPGNYALLVGLAGLTFVMLRRRR